VLSSSVACYDVISHAKLFYFFTDQPRNPWVPRNPGWKSLV